MTTRRFARRAGRFAWRNRQTIGRAAYTLLGLKPVVSYAPITNQRYNITDLTSTFFSSSTGTGPMASPTVAAVRGVLSFQRTDATVAAGIPYGWALFVGPRLLDAEDVPFFFSEPDRFMGYGMRIQDFAPRSAVAADFGSGQDGYARPAGVSQMRVFNRYQKRLRVGDRLWLVTRVAASMGQLESETQPGDFAIRGEIQVLLRSRS